MADDHNRDELAQLRAQVATLQARMDRPRRPVPRLPRRFLPLALVALLVLLTPLSLLAASPFNDLTGGVHDPNIGLIYDAGITKGCVPNVSYCPTANVTREEMASFLARTAGLGTNPPVVNAKTAQTAALATNATTVGGYAPNGLVRVARGTAAKLPLTLTLQAVATVSLTTPAAGFVLVNGTTSPQGAAGDPTCFIEVRLRDAVGGATTGANYTRLTSDEEQVASLVYVFPVAAGVQSYELQARVQPFGTCNTNAYSSVITALYVPFGSTGGTTLDLPAVPADTPHTGPGNH